MAQNSAGHYLAIARILRPQGRKGEVAAEILTDFPERFSGLRSAFVEVPGQAPQPLGVESSWPHKGRIILKFSGVDTIEGASRLRGLQVLIPWEQRMPLPEHHYYLCELQDCTVVWRGKEIGMVGEVESTGGVDILHVRRTDGNEVLIPFAQEICTQIDLSARRIVIDPPEDLIELNEPGGVKDKQ